VFVWRSFYAMRIETTVKSQQQAPPKVGARAA
jgi:hypothetical protein